MRFLLLILLTVLSASGGTFSNLVYGTALVRGDALVARGVENYTNGLVGLWKFDENTGTTTADSSGYGNTGTLTNNPYWTNGVSGPAIYFNTNAVLGGTGLNTYTNQLSVFAWVKAGTNTDHVIVARYSTTDNKRVWLMSQSAAVVGRLQVILAGNGAASTSKNYYTSNSVFDGNWHHVGFAWDRTNLTLYVDGTAAPVVKARDDAMSSISAEATPLTIGARYSGIGTLGGQMTGSVDEVRLYNRALTTNEITGIYNREKP